MRPISPKVKEAILNDPLYVQCTRALLLNDHVCAGRITWEHSLIYAGRQIDEKWALVSLCAYAHGVDEYQDGGCLDKKINEWIAINRMSREDEMKYPRRNWAQERRFLNARYGVPVYPQLPRH